MVQVEQHFQTQLWLHCSKNYYIIYKEKNLPDNLAMMDRNGGCSRYLYIDSGLSINKY